MVCTPATLLKNLGKEFGNRLLRYILYIHKDTNLQHVYIVKFYDVSTLTVSTLSMYRLSSATNLTVLFCESESFLSLVGEYIAISEIRAY